MPHRKVNMVWKFLLIHGIVLLPWSQVPLFLKLKKAHISLYPQRIWLRGAPQTSDTEGIKAFMKRMLEL